MLWVVACAVWRGAVFPVTRSFPVSRSRVYKGKSDAYLYGSTRYLARDLCVLRNYVVFILAWIVFAILTEERARPESVPSADTTLRSHGPCVHTVEHRGRRRVVTCTARQSRDSETALSQRVRGSCGASSPGVPRRPRRQAATRLGPQRLPDHMSRKKPWLSEMAAPGRGMSATCLRLRPPRVLAPSV